MKVGYLCSRYPAISHTFIMREVHALREAGIDVDTFTIRRVPQGELLTERDREEDRRTWSVLPAGVLRLIGAHLGVGLRRPAKYAAAFLASLSDRPPGLRALLWSLYYFAEAGVLSAELIRRRISHVHAHFANVAANVAGLAARMTGGTWSLTVHGQSDFGDPVSSRLRQKTNSAAFVACVSDFGRAQAMLQARPADWPKIHRVYCGIDPLRFQPVAGGATDPPPREDQPLRLLTVARLSPEKGLGVLLEAVERAVNDGHRVQCMLVGDGPERGGLQRLAMELGVAGDVEFAGAVGQDRIREVYAAADVFVLPSFSEGLPVVLMEAMAMGLPVIATRITGVPELIEHGVDGWLVTPGRSDLLAEAIVTLAADTDLRVRLGRAAREKILRQFDSRATAQPLISLFRTVLGSRRVGAAATPGEGSSRSAAVISQPAAVRRPSQV